MTDRTGGVLIFGFDHSASDKGQSSFVRNLALSLHEQGVPTTIVYLTELPDSSIQVDRETQGPVHRIRVNVWPFSQKALLSQYNDGLSPSFYADGSRAQLARSVALLKGLPTLARLVIRYRPRAVLLSDNMGVFTCLIKAVAPKACLTGLVPVFRRGTPAYRRFLQACYWPLDQIVATNHGIANEVIQSGVSKDKVIVIPWGVYPGPEPDVLVDRSCQRQVLTWSGPLQCMTSQDMDAARTIADSISIKHPYLRKVFAFKPSWCASNELPDFPSDVAVLSSTESYVQALTTTSVLLSPIGSHSRDGVAVLGPPLTWIEFMERGAIVATLRMPGVEELIEDGQNGLVCSSVEELDERTDALLRDDGALRDMRGEARRTILERFNTREIATRYMDIWDI